IALIRFLRFTALALARFVEQRIEQLAQLRAQLARKSARSREVRRLLEARTSSPSRCTTLPNQENQHANASLAARLHCRNWCKASRLKLASRTCPDEERSAHRRKKGGAHADRHGARHRGNDGRDRHQGVGPLQSAAEPEVEHERGRSRRD